MTVTMAIRYLVADPKVGMAAAKRAKAMWTKAGARDFRSSQFFTGEFVGIWLFHIVFDDFAHMEKARSEVMKTKEWATMNANNAKAGNKMVAREILIGLDV